MSLEDDKNKLKYEHDLAVQRLLLEKFILAILVIAVGIFANMALENFKSGLADRKYLIETHERILNDIRKHYTVLTDHAYGIVHVEKSNDELIKKKYLTILKDYRKDLQKFTNLLNSSGRYFSNEFEMRLQRHVWFHEALAFNHSKLEINDWAFVISIFENFGYLTRNAVSKDKIEAANEGVDGEFVMLNWSMRRIFEEKAGGYLDALHKKWKLQIKAETVPAPSN